jgi:alpha-glucosidase
VKGGSIIPMQSSIQFTSEKPNETLEIHVYKGSSGEPFYLYEDDGVTYTFEDGAYYQRSMQLFDSANRLVLSKVEGSFESKYTFLRFVFHGFGDQITKLNVNNKPMKVSSAISGYLGSFSEEFNPSQTTQFVIDNINQEIIINW